MANAVTPRLPASGVVRVNRTKASAWSPLVIHALDPFTTKSSPSRSALQVKLPASEPDPVSDSA
jgi:hypothetical protein